ncbi:MAG: hypothetical protein ALECFALPRED_009212 [Alectoria fallacina]|uniref:DUF7580 domain-containing protein n=1 Tax=Alectoria fallacina TaxID=1903189 RepID=A0A8H3IFK8_9LECA|nr:MAG: hypothetical protein ALECFALPRED_009212 [Alectoria fallacina]
MSGFEVGGIVVAVFPLVVGAIERVLANESSLRLWEAQACRIELEAVQLEVQVQEVLFQNSYLKLLLSFLDRRQTIKLLADPDSFRKNNVEITKNLKSHLGEQWIVYQGVMTRLESTLRTFKASVDMAMGVDENGDELSKLKLLLRRIRFSLYTRQRSGLLKRLKDDNQTLATLTDQQRTLKSLGTYQHPGVNVDTATCLEMHRQAVDVFHSLASNVAAKSEHWFAHAASMYFTSFMPPDLADGPAFSIALRGQDQDGLSRSIDWRIAKCMEASHNYLSICDSYRDLCAVAPSVPPDNLSDSVERQTRKSSAPSLLGCLQSSAEPFGGYTLKLETVIETPTSISLAGIVSADRNFACYPRYFLENDRARLAATLASSLLCLHDSPWLKSSWSSRDVFFETASGDVSSESLLRPHTKVAFPRTFDESEPQSTANGEVQPSPSTQFGILNRSLYSLGMVLLELIMNETLESFKQRNDETESEVAWRLERQVCGRAGLLWADIVFACLHCPFQKTPDLANENFLQLISVHVVTPLIEMARLGQTYAVLDNE